MAVFWRVSGDLKLKVHNPFTMATQVTKPAYDTSSDTSHHNSHSEGLLYSDSLDLVIFTAD